MTRQASCVLGLILALGGCAGAELDDGDEAAAPASVEALTSATSLSDEEATASTRLGDCEMKAGDVIFQRSLSEQAGAIAYITESELTHVGVLFKIAGAWNVYEAVGPVKITPLSSWVARGQGRRFATSRWESGLTKEMAKALFEAGKPFYGKPYDLLFTEDDATIYCSELVLKMYSRASDASAEPWSTQLGRLWKRVDAFAGWSTFQEDLQSPADSSGETLMKRIMAARGVDVHEFARQVVIAPVTLADAEQSGGLFEQRCALAAR